MVLVLKGEKDVPNKDEPENTGLTPVIFNNYEDVFKNDILSSAIKCIHHDLIEINLEDKTKEDDKPQELHLEVSHFFDERWFVCEIIMWPETPEDLKNCQTIMKAQGGRKLEATLKEKLKKKGRIPQMSASKLYFKRRLDENNNETDEYEYDTGKLNESQDRCAYKVYVSPRWRGT